MRCLRSNILSSFSLLELCCRAFISSTKSSLCVCVRVGSGWRIGGVRSECVGW